jgi:putative Ca2+/H+ antiporter (TMEM165/GDT1 family)
MSIEHVLRAFGTVFPAELPDKTMIATIVLVTRYRRPLAVWTGGVVAFTVHVIVAVAAGSALSLLPDVLVKSIVAAMFSVGAALLLRAACSADRAVDVETRPAHASARAAVVGSFGLVVLAEWGDLTQLATASLAATSGDPVGTGIGALAALASVAAIAASFGRQLVARVPLHRVNYVGAAVFAVLAVWTLIELVR